MAITLDFTTTLIATRPAFTSSSAKQCGGAEGRLLFVHTPPPLPTTCELKREQVICSNYFMPLFGTDPLMSS